MIIHDGIRPLVDDTVLTDVIIKCRPWKRGFFVDCLNEQISGSRMELPSTFPEKRCAGWRHQAYRFGKLDWAYHEALRRSAFTVLPMPTP